MFSRIIVTGMISALLPLGSTVLSQQRAALPDIVELSANRWTVDEGARIEFVAKATHADGLALTYEWDFGDGTPVHRAQNEMVASHVFRDDGEYNVTLTVRDTAGRLASRSVTVVVRNVAPKITSLDWSGSGAPGESLAFSATVYDPGVEDILTYQWDFGDGSDLQSGVDLRTAHHTYREAGLYTVTLTVEDGDGGEDRRTTGVLIGGGFVYRASGQISESVKGQLYGVQAVPMHADGTGAFDLQAALRAQAAQADPSLPCFVQLIVVPDTGTSLFQDLMATGGRLEGAFEVFGQRRGPSLTLTAVLFGGLRPGSYPVGDRVALGPRVMPQQAEFGSPGVFFAQFTHPSPEGWAGTDADVYPSFGSRTGNVEILRFQDDRLELRFSLAIEQSRPRIRYIPATESSPVRTEELPPLQADLTGHISHVVKRGLGQIGKDFYLCTEQRLLEVVSVSPEPGSENVDFERPQIELEFSQTVDLDEVKETVFVIYRPADPEDEDDFEEVSGGFERVSDRRFRFIPQTSLRDGLRYRIFVHGGENGIVSRDGAILAHDYHADFWTLVDVEEVELAAFQVARETRLVPNKPTLTRVYVRWREKPDVHPGWQVREFTANVTVTGDGQPIYAPRQAERIRRPDTLTTGARRRAENSVNFFNWRPGKTRGVTNLQAQIEPLGADGPTGKIFLSPEVTVQHWEMQEGLKADVYVLGVSEWREGVPGWVPQRTRDMLRLSELYTTQTFPVVWTSLRYQGVLDPPVHLVDDEPTILRGGMSRWRISVMQWFSRTVAARSDADLVVAVVPPSWEVGKYWSAWSNRNVGIEISPGEWEIDQEAFQAFLFPTVHIPMFSDLHPKYMAMALIHEFGHAYHLRHVPTATRATERDRVCGVSEPIIASAPESIEGFRMSRSGRYGANKSHVEGNQESSDDVIAAVMHPCVPNYEIEQVFMTNRQYEELLHYLARDYRVPYSESGRLPQKSEPHLFARLFHRIRQAIDRGPFQPSLGWSFFERRAERSLPRSFRTRIPSATGQDTPRESEGRFLHLLGFIEEGEVTLLDVDVLVPARPPVSQEGAFRLTLLDESSAVLSTSTFSVRTAGDDPRQWFYAAVPYSPNARSFTLSENGAILLERRRNMQPPEIRSFEPAADARLEGTGALSWEVFAAEGNPVSVKAWYSATGGDPWHLLGTGGATGRLEFEVEVLEPGPEPTLMLSAGDGFDAVEIRRPVRLATGLRVTGIDPSGEEQSAPAADITVWFNGPVARETAEERIRLLDAEGHEVPVFLYVVEALRAVVLTPVQPLIPEKHYRLQVTEGLTDLNGLRLGRAFETEFSVAEVSGGGESLATIREEPSTVPKAEYETTPILDETDSRTGTLEATFDDQDLVLGTFPSEEGNTAAWMPLGDGNYGVFINAFSDENFSPRGAVSIRMVFSDLDGNCPCAPIELVIRYYQGDSYQGQYYESQNVRAVLTRLQRIDGDNFEVEGNFAGRFGFLQSAGGRVGRTVAGKGNFRAVVERVRQ